MRIVISICLLFVLAGCKKSTSTSNCIQSKVDEFRSQARCVGANVKEYFFEGKIVYVFYKGLCFVDAGAQVYDEDCNYLGMLGGLPYNKKIVGVDFGVTAEYKRTSWE